MDPNDKLHQQLILAELVLTFLEPDAGWSDEETTEEIPHETMRDLVETDARR